MVSTEWPKHSAVAILLSAGATVLSLVGAFYALVFAALTCDESCDDRSSAWRDNPDAWQWLGQFGLAAFAALASIYALVAALRRRRVSHALIASAVAWAAWWAFLSL